MAVFLGVVWIKIRLYQVNSLKNKRAIIRPVRDKLKNSFNVSIIEADGQDSKYEAVLLAVGAADSTGRAASLMETLIGFIEREFPQLDITFEDEIIQI